MAHSANRGQAIKVTLEASLIAGPVLAVARACFTGTATELLARLETHVDDDVRRKKAWPKAAHVLSGQLRRLAPGLRAAGVEIEFGRGDERTITITRKPPGSSVGSDGSDGSGASPDASDASDASSQTFSGDHEASA